MSWAADCVALATVGRVDDAGTVVAAFLALVTPINAYWGFGGGGLAWVLECDCAVPLPPVWVQQVALLH